MDKNWLELSYKNWLESKNEKPKGSPDVKTEKGYPAYFLSPEDIASYINSIDVWDLFTKPNTQPFYLDYPTTAINVRNRENKDKEVTTLFPNKSSVAKYGINTNWLNNLLENAMGVYKHEVGHAKDLRINPEKMWSFLNHGFTTYGGLSGGLLQREFPAMVAEEDYLDSLKK
jgi:hypothetical protein